MAWDDVAVLSVLLGDAEGARMAFDRFRRTGSRPTDIDSVVPILTRTADAAPGVDQEVEASAREMTTLLEGIRDAG